MCNMQTDRCGSCGLRLLPSRLAVSANPTSLPRLQSNQLAQQPHNEDRYRATYDFLHHRLRLCQWNVVGSFQDHNFDCWLLWCGCCLEVWHFLDCWSPAVAHWPDHWLSAEVAELQQDRQQISCVVLCHQTEIFKNQLLNNASTNNNNNNRICRADVLEVHKYDTAG